MAKQKENHSLPPLFVSRRAMIGGGAAAMAVGLIPKMACACGVAHSPVQIGGELVDFRTKIGSVCWRNLCNVWALKNSNIVLPAPDAVDLAGRIIRVEGYLIPPQGNSKNMILSAFRRKTVEDVPGGAAGLIDIVSTQPINWVEGVQTIEGRFELLEIPENTASIQPIYRVADARIHAFCNQYAPLPTSVGPDSG